MFRVDIPVTGLFRVVLRELARPSHRSRPYLSQSSFFSSSAGEDARAFFDVDMETECSREAKLRVHHLKQVYYRSLTKSISEDILLLPSRVDAATVFGHRRTFPAGCRWDVTTSAVTTRLDKMELFI